MINSLSRFLNANIEQSAEKTNKKRKKILLFFIKKKCVKGRFRAENRIFFVILRSQLAHLLHYCQNSKQLVIN